MVQHLIMILFLTIGTWWVIGAAAMLITVKCMKDTMPRAVHVFLGSFFGILMIPICLYNWKYYRLEQDNKKKENKKRTPVS